jgi:transposase InsO family protein
MTEEMKELGFDVGHRRVGRLMQENGIEVKRNKKFKGKEDQETIRGIVSPTSGQQSQLQYRAEPAEAGLPCRPPEPEMGR